MKKYGAIGGITLAAALTLSALAGCGSTSASSANGKTFIITNKSIDAKVSDKFIIQLESNATTGFQWGLSGSLNPSVVEKVSSTYVSDPNPKGLMGAGGVEKWTFKAVGKGTGTIALVYSQPWDKTAKPAKSATFTINVQ